MGEITGYLDQIRAGDESAMRRLWESAHRELYLVATRAMRNERKDHTLTPTDLVNEAYLRLCNEIGYRSRRAFMALATTTMHRVLVDHARRRSTQKRGGEWVRDELTANQPDVQPDALPRPDDLASLTEAIEQLAATDRRAATIATLRMLEYQHEEIAGVLGLSEVTIRREWKRAREWLLLWLEE